MKKIQLSETEIQVGCFGGIEALFKLEEIFAGQGIDPRLIVGALDADEPDIDLLCLRLLVLLEAKRNLPKEGVGFIEARRKAISDATINYLIMEILEATDRCGQSIRIPSSLVVLIREQLCGSNPDLHRLYLARERFRNAAHSARRHFQQTSEQISVRKLAAAAGVSRGTAERWLADEHFQRLFRHRPKVWCQQPLLKMEKNCQKRAHKKRAGARRRPIKKNMSDTKNT